MIGDRGIALADGDFAFVWDLGEEWTQWTGLPFVFALWIARPGVELPGVAALLAQPATKGLRGWRKLPGARRRGWEFPRRNVCRTSATT